MTDCPATRMRYRRWTIAGLLLAAVWAGVAGVTAWARSAAPTPADAVAAAAAVRGADDADRPRQVEALTRAVRRLTLSQRGEPAVAEALRGALGSMSAQQRLAFLDATLPMGLDEMAAAYLNLDDAGRARLSHWVYQELTDRGWRPESLSLRAFRRLFEGYAEAFARGDDTAAQLEALPAMARVLHVMRDLDPGDAAKWWAGEGDD
ncbi:MAG: hypothetical protein AAF710_03960 [Planctomycetota bacterium]